ncbi:MULTISPECIES: small membrane protein [Klebsiella]|uniref:Small membrane protein n=1 Tax=Klebsiella indica TaxID=2582917 RepID=A0A5R9LKW8_9ENTR|nr:MULTISPECIES: small membrane protein [Klebsiella]TLV21552.1 small membrane protein [Klebsiella indica]HDY8629327.1 small membrane protein [Klebsiella pneumoniae]HDY8728197.1 small membrane protein [Klebsiella pneumoniae]
MTMQTWLALLLCVFCLCISVYSLVSYLRDRKKQKLPFSAKNSMRRK